MYRARNAWYSQYLAVLAAALVLVTVSMGDAIAGRDSDEHEHDHDDRELKIEDLEAEGETPVQLYVFDCGTIVVHELAVFNAALEPGVEKTLSNSCYLIRHPNGTLIWDSGLPDELAALPDGTDVAGGIFTVSMTKTLASQLEEVGIDPLDVDYVAFSHMHFDHTGNANLFTNSTWLIQEVEHDLAFSDGAVAASFEPASYSALAANEVVRLNGHYDVFGDKSVVILSAPGHTVGHQVLYLDMPETGPVVLSGDLYHFMENRVNYGIPIFNSSIRESIHSFVLVDNFLDQLNAELWIQHDKPTFDSLMKSPLYYQ